MLGLNVNRVELYITSSKWRIFPHPKLQFQGYN